MGNTASQPKNKTGKKVLTQKLENAKKTGILSLREHKLDTIPPQVFTITNLTSLDVSKNNLKSLGKLSALTNLKSLNVEDNKLPAGSLSAIAGLSKLQTLTAGGNTLGKPHVVTNEKTKQKRTIESLPKTLPKSLKTIKLDNNSFSSIPKQLCDAKLVKLVKLDLSRNNLAAVPPELSNLASSLTELNLDSNSIVSLPPELGQLSKLKSLSLQNNDITAPAVITEQNPQPIPATIFRDTSVVDLNLHGNRMTSTQLNEFEGYSDFLERRKKIKSKGVDGGALVDLDVCGLD